MIDRRLRFRLDEDKRYYSVKQRVEEIDIRHAMQDESAAQRAQRAPAAVSQPAVYAAATPPVMILPEIKPAQKAAQLPKTGTAAGPEAPPAGWEVLTLGSHRRFPRGNLICCS